ncbi:hypothetical protein [Propionimicrobium lymphophilum]|uniref:hypothetical protein n=1 Tax=Propionimicrobium lymphophilum TaxID=33012 RepID=UPI003EC6AC4E
MSECYSACLMAGTALIIACATGALFGDILGLLLVAWIRKRQSKREIQRWQARYQNSALKTSESN